MVELFFEVVGGGLVEAVAVFEEVEGLAEMGAHELGIGSVTVEGAFDAV